MSTYCVGDIQGCYAPLVKLLDRVNFSAQHDTLISVGDLINRGPDNLKVVRLARSLGSSFKAVLGNHDLSFLAVTFGARKRKAKDTTGDLFAAPELDEIIQWFRYLPLALLAEGHLVVHAGVAPDWDTAQTLSYAGEVSAALRGDDAPAFLEQMFGDTPARFDESLQGFARLRVITNVLTRMRFCSSTGELDLHNKLGAEHAPPGMLPWFAHPHRKAAQQSIVFGHWASLDGKASAPTVHALDTGCVWGKQLTCLRLEDLTRFACDC